MQWKYSIDLNRKPNTQVLLFPHCSRVTVAQQCKLVLGGSNFHTNMLVVPGHQEQRFATPNLGNTGAPFLIPLAITDKAEGPSTWKPNAIEVTPAVS